MTLLPFSVITAIMILDKMIIISPAGSCAQFSQKGQLTQMKHRPPQPPAVITEPGIASTVEQSPTLWLRRHGATLYEVSIHFKPQAKEGLSEKLTRLISADASTKQDR